MKLSYRACALPLAAAAAFAFVQSGCSSSGSDGGTGGSGGAITSCVPTAAECYGPGGPGGPGSECLAKADNTGADTIQLRFSQLEVAAPTALAGPFMQDAIITKKTTFNQANCFQNGLGQFNTLFEFDTKAMTVKAGGGVPQALIGPPADGTCFASFTDAQSKIQIGPQETAFTMTGNDVHAIFDAGSKMTPPQPDLVIPIYLDDKLDQYVLLPLHEVDVTATLSDDHNCVGAYRGNELSVADSCNPKQGDFAWTNGGAFNAYVTVTESDTVMIQSLGYSLCVLLSGDVAKWKGDNVDCGVDAATGKSVTCAVCKGSKGYTDTGALPVGDWCSTSNSEGGCNDAFHLETKFAASAIPIKGNFDTTTNKCGG